MLRRSSPRSLWSASRPRLVLCFLLLALSHLGHAVCDGAVDAASAQVDVGHIDMQQHQAASNEEQPQPAGEPEQNSPAGEQFTGDAAVSRQAETSHQRRSVGEALSGQSLGGTPSGEQDAEHSLQSQPTGQQTQPEQSIGRLDEAAPAMSKADEWWEVMARDAAGCAVQDAAVAKQLSSARSDSGNACEAACRWANRGDLLVQHALCLALCCQRIRIELQAQA